MVLVSQPDSIEQRDRLGFLMPAAEARTNTARLTCGPSCKRNTPDRNLGLYRNCSLGQSAEATTLSPFGFIRRAVYRGVRNQFERSILWINESSLHDFPRSRAR